MISLSRRWQKFGRLMKCLIKSMNIKEWTTTSIKREVVKYLNLKDLNENPFDLSILTYN
jgi:hypothetical protein